MTHRRAAGLLALCALAGCARAGPEPPGALAIEWSSPDTTIGRATWRGHAEAGWCEARHLLTVFASRGDTGAALAVTLPALAPVDSMPIAAVTDTAPVPRATVAVRWSGNDAVRALSSQGGTLRLTRVSPTLSASFEGLLVHQGDDELGPPKIAGRLADVPVATGELGCRLAGVGQTP